MRTHQRAHGPSIRKLVCWGRRSRTGALGTCVSPFSICGTPASFPYSSNLGLLVLPIPGLHREVRKALFLWCHRCLILELSISCFFCLQHSSRRGFQSCLLSLLLLAEAFPIPTSCGFPPGQHLFSSELLPLLEIIYLAWCLFVPVCSPVPEI